MTGRHIIKDCRKLIRKGAYSRSGQGMQPEFKELPFGFGRGGSKSEFKVMPRLVRCARPPMQFAKDGIPKMESYQPGRQIHAR